MTQTLQQQLGTAFKLLRESKELSQSTFEGMGLSRRSIMNFEKSEKMLEIDKLDNALAFMDTSLAEYEYLANDWALDDFEETFLTLEHAYYKEDLKVIKKIEAEYQEKDRRISLSAKATYTKLTEKEKTFLADYIFGVEIWGFYELSLLSFIVEQLSPALMASIVDGWYNATAPFKLIFKYRRKMQQCLHRSVMVLCQAKDKEMAEHLLNRAQKLLFERDTFSRVMHRFVRGYYTWCFLDKEAGNILMKSAIHIFTETGSEDLAQHYQKVYDIYVTKFLKES
ncbi:hypothetical protein GHI93_11160 [Lactococcus hircilactis]|uniref:HTH-type transcriptional regulator Rgg C-terminal domain-containing protein n=1 Tax=Lactococcus hircilactis TaxID=1494462 RepID=A0A7X2D2H9_9LACT|nr:Rgg/GadR/MutR family transcriptional regulator [Lactococcus hircilactis]MQW40477.1 hypothetical protein [Lactococcus hircilactis]